MLEIVHVDLFYDRESQHGLCRRRLEIVARLTTLSLFDVFLLVRSEIGAAPIGAYERPLIPPRLTRCFAEWIEGGLPPWDVDAPFHADCSHEYDRGGRRGGGGG